MDQNQIETLKAEAFALEYLLDVENGFGVLTPIKPGGYHISEVGKRLPLADINLVLCAIRLRRA